MPVPTPNTIASNRWRSADALLAIAEDPKASARERRLAAMAVLDLCDKAEAALAAQVPAQSAASAPAQRSSDHAQPVPQLERRPQQQAHPAPQPTAPTAAPIQAVIQPPAHRQSATASVQPALRADHTPAQPRAA